MGKFVDINNLKFFDDLINPEFDNKQIKLDFKNSKTDCNKLYDCYIDETGYIQCLISIENNSFKPLGKYKGDKGDNNESLIDLTGPKGEQGEDGKNINNDPQFIGDKGPVGEIGDKGPVGEIGDKGPAGTSIIEGKGDMFAYPPSDCIKATNKYCIPSEELNFDKFPKPAFDDINYTYQKGYLSKPHKNAINKISEVYGSNVPFPGNHTSFNVRLEIMPTGTAPSIEISKNHLPEFLIFDGLNDYTIGVWNEGSKNEKWASYPGYNHINLQFNNNSGKYYARVCNSIKMYAKYKNKETSQSGYKLYGDYTTYDRTTKKNSQSAYIWPHSTHTFASGSSGCNNFYILYVPKEFTVTIKVPCDTEGTIPIDFKNLNIIQKDTDPLDKNNLSVNQAFGGNY